MGGRLKAQMGGWDSLLSIYESVPDAATGETILVRRSRTATSELEYELQSFGLQLNKITVLNAARPGLDPALSSPGHVVDVRT